MLEAGTGLSTITLDVLIKLMPNYNAKLLHRIMLLGMTLNPYMTTL